MPEISIKTTEERLSTPIPNWFIDNYLNGVNPTFIVVYLFYFRYSYSGKNTPSTEKAADILGILESDIIKAFKYWESVDVLKLSEGEGYLCINFLEPSLESKKTQPVPKKNININSIPQYSVKELEIYQSSSHEIDKLFKFAEQQLGTLLKYSDLNTLFGLYDWLKLPLDVIHILISYCASADKRNMNYIQSIAIDWAEKGINTPEKANAHITTFKKDYREILKALGLSKYDPAPIQIEFMDRWLKEYNMPLEVILEACDKCVISGKGDFRYCEGIVKVWHEKGIKTIEDVKKHEERFKSEESTSKRTKAKKPKANRFANFPQREWDFDKIEEAGRKELDI